MGRGKRSDVVGLPAVIVDIDFRSGVHAVGDRNPLEEDAKRWIAAAPRPTVILHSGGGFHLYYVLDEFADPDSQNTVGLLARHKAFWTQLAEADGLSIDKAVLADPARILRPAGTWNSNQGAPAKLLSTDGPTYTVKDLTAAYPDVPVEVSRRARAASEPRIRAASRSSPQSGERVGDRFAIAVPADQFLIEVLGGEERAQDGFSLPGPDGELSPYDTARAYRDTGEPTKVTIFDTCVQDVFGLDSNEHSWTSFHLLAACLGSGDDGFRAAARLAGRHEQAGTWPANFFETIRAAMLGSMADAFGIEQDAPDGYFYFDQQPPGGDGLLEYLPPADVVVVAEMPRVIYPDTDAGNDSALAALLATTPALKATTVLPATRHEVAVVAQTIASALETKTPGRFPLDGGMVAYVWTPSKEGMPKRHGVYKITRVQDASGKVTWPEEQLTSWVAFKSFEILQLSVDPDGVEVVVTEPKVSVTMATSTGRTKTMPGFTLAQAHDPKIVVDALNMGVSLPISATAKGHVGNSLRTLGADDQGTETIGQYGTLGWLKAPETGEWVYLSPAGSVSASGPAPEFTVGAPPRSEDGALTPMQRSIGWPEIPQDASAIRQAAEAVPAFLAITPDNPAAFAILGLMFAAPLALGSRCTVFLAALPGSGKSNLTAAGQAFLTGDAFGSSWTGGDIGSATVKGAAISARWARHGVSFWDDYRVPKDDMGKAAQMRGVVTTVLQAAYGGTDSGMKSTVDGGLLQVRVGETSSIMTGEALPEEEGILSRAISVEIAVGDIKLMPLGTSPLDVFRLQQAASARFIYGAYIQWLAARVARAGSLKVFREENAKARLELTPSSGRSAQTASVLAIGWAIFKEFAVENGFDDILPGEDSVTEIVETLSGANAELVRESNPAVSIIRAARDMVAASSGHIELHNGTTPLRDQAMTLGWVRGHTNNFGEHLVEPTRFTIGTLTKDGRWVVLKSNAVAEIKKRIGLGGLPAGQLNAGFASLVMAGSEPGGRSPRELGLNRSRGYALPAALFDLGSDIS
ncbi:hypothetical protein [Cryobacterium sp. CG_9.6]|uniref:hypothetical protein n=1 Tax=Cryobacterium sp. CG_9.6 TaxID=2760710 RepID=UPI002473670E|nr:hypothetical protein [Cryobacterium sp. CG_9.6]MDH6236287.1 hypothetical protein [Cryobacterium sp. CG_9.6]